MLEQCWWCANDSSCQLLFCFTIKTCIHTRTHTNAYNRIHSHTNVRVSATTTLHYCAAHNRTHTQYQGCFFLPCELLSRRRRHRHLSSGVPMCVSRTALTAHTNTTLPLHLKLLKLRARSAPPHASMHARTYIHRIPGYAASSRVAPHGIVVCCWNLSFLFFAHSDLIHAQHDALRCSLFCTLKCPIRFVNFFKSPTNLAVLQN